MINGIHDPNNLHTRYEAAAPFPHITLDDFLVPRFADEIASELDSCDLDQWYRDDHPDQVLKRTMDDLDRLPDLTGTVLRFMNSELACRFFLHSRASRISSPIPPMPEVGYT